MINQMVMGYTNIKTVLLMKGYGVIKCRMNMTLRIGMKGRVIKENTKKVRRLELDNIYGQTVRDIVESGKILI